MDKAKGRIVVIGQRRAGKSLMCQLLRKKFPTTEVVELAETEKYPSYSFGLNDRVLFVTKDSDLHITEMGLPYHVDVIVNDGGMDRLNDQLAHLLG